MLPIVFWKEILCYNLITLHHFHSKYPYKSHCMKWLQQVAIKTMDWTVDNSVQIFFPPVHSLDFPQSASKLQNGTDLGMKIMIYERALWKKVRLLDSVFVKLPSHYLFCVGNFINIYTNGCIFSLFTAKGTTQYKKYTVQPLPCPVIQIYPSLRKLIMNLNAV